MIATAFANSTRIAAGPLAEVALAVRRFQQAVPDTAVLIFDDAKGRVIDLDLRGTEAEIVARLPTSAELPAPRAPGRPKLGVVPREVTLLPRHWDWLSAQPGGASATLRRLVEDARKADGGAGRSRALQERCYRFLTAIAGDLPCYEEAIRALFADDRPALAAKMQDWPPDISAHALHLLQAAED